MSERIFPAVQIHCVDQFNVVEPNKIFKAEDLSSLLHALSNVNHSFWITDEWQKNITMDEALALFGGNAVLRAFTEKKATVFPENEEKVLYYVEIADKFKILELVRNERNSGSNEAVA